MKQQNKYMLTETQREFIKNSLSEFKSQSSMRVLTKRTVNGVNSNNNNNNNGSGTNKESELMQMFLLGKNHKDKNNNNNTITNIYSNRNNNNILSVNKRNTILKHELRMKILNNQHPTLSPINTNTISTHKYLPSINSQFNISPLSQNLSYTSFPKNPKHKSTEPKTSTSTSSQQTFHFHTPTPFLNLKQHSSHNHIKSFPTPQCILSPFKYHKQPKTTRKQHLPTHTHLKPQLTLRERLQNPNITFLHNLHKKLLRKRKKLFETIILPTNITDMYEHNSHLPPSTIAIDSFISRTYETSSYKTPSISFIIRDIFNFKGFCVFGICECKSTHPKAQLISLIARECLTNHLTNPITYNLKSTSTITNVLHAIVDNEFEVINNAFISIQDELSDVNIKDNVKHVLSVMMLICIDDEIIVCEYGKDVKGFWLKKEKEVNGKELLSSCDICDNKNDNEKELLIVKRIKCYRNMNYIIMGSRLFWENITVDNIMKIISDCKMNLNDMICKIRNYKKVLSRKYFHCNTENNVNNGVDDDIKSISLLYSIIILKL